MEIIIYGLLILILISIVVAFAGIVGGICLVLLPFIIAYMIYEYFYFKSEKFIQVKNSIQEHTDECNELNSHIEELKKAYINFEQIDYGNASYVDTSNYNYQRKELKKFNKSQNIYNCSLTVCRNAQQQPFKYLCKYFNIEINEKTLEKFEKVLNDFSAAEQGKVLLKNQRDKIIEGISEQIPVLIKTFSRKKLIKKLGFREIDFSKLYFPQYSFKYISAGGNSSMNCDIVFDVENLNKFIKYLSNVIKFKKSIAGQRALMTSELREKIKSRDKYTCQNCGLSVNDEPNLLLEIDHIIPLSKNGLTVEENLQTLCWKCNRKKGNKIIEKTKSETTKKGY